MHIFKTTTAVLSVLVLIITGCGSSSKNEMAELLPAKSLSRLKTVQSTVGLSETIKARMILAMEARIDNTLTELYENETYCMREQLELMDDVVYSQGSAPDSAQNGSAGDYSTTNDQVAGVDEADFIKNDGEYIYLATGSTFKIIDAWPPEEANIVSSVPVEGDATRLYIYSNKAVVFSSIDRDDSSGAKNMDYYGFRDCSYGYNCDFTGDGKKLKITIFNIENRLQPELEREIAFSGSYLNARRIDNALHVIVNYPEIRIPGIIYWPESFDWCFSRDEEPDRDKITALFEALKEKNRQLIHAGNLEEFLPEIKDTRYSGTVTPVTENRLTLENLYESQLPDGNSVLTVASIDLDTMTDIVQSSVIGRSGAVYGSGESLYIASRERYNPFLPWFFSPGLSEKFNEVTTVHRFDIQKNPAASAYDSSCAVKGRILNQFSMDEYNGALRIATTSGQMFSGDLHNTLSVLMKEGDELNVVGIVDNIAKTEDIRSVRFDGDKGYVVTFKKTDPLFVFDLSDPVNPRITGELKIPGFSTYMHLMDEHHLLTIGYDADEAGSFAWFDGIMLQIFDVEDMEKPVLTHKEIIGTRGSSSEGTLNHLAFNYFAAKDLLAIPVTVCEGGDNGSYGQDLTFSGLLVYDVTAEAGFSERAGISHLDPESPVTCSNWWTNANSIVKRSIFMDDYVFSIAMDKIKIAKLENPVQDIGTIVIE